MRTVIILILLHLSSCSKVYSQEARATLIAFYNVENLFSPHRSEVPEPSSSVYDQPEWNLRRYNAKLRNLGRAIRALGSLNGKPGPDLLGLAEVENAGVLQDLIHHDALQGGDYEVIHKDSPDHRGIDVALIYRRSSFIPHHTETHTLRMYHEEGYRLYTRDLLVVSGYLEEELIHILINHWPSRRGGKEQSARLRSLAAKLNRKAIDSIKRLYSEPFLITMGDFNDDPTDPSMYYGLRGRDKASDSLETLFNPMLDLFRKGYGSLAYRDRWHLFDQILLSGEKIGNQEHSYAYKKAGIFMPAWLRSSRGAYRGYPLRTYIGKTYTGGFSDHFPVYVIFTANDPNPLVEPEVVGNSGKNEN